MAFFIADHATRGDSSRAAFARIFGVAIEEAFPRELDFLVRSGLIAGCGDRLHKPPRLDFQASHLLAFLLRNGAVLANQVRSHGARLRTRERDADSDDTAPPPAARQPEVIAFASGDDIESSSRYFSSAIRHNSAGALVIDVGGGLDGEDSHSPRRPRREQGPHD